MFPPV